MDKSTMFAHKKSAYFASVMIKIGSNFVFCLFSGSMLHFKVKCPQLAQRYTWDFAFTERSAVVVLGSVQSVQGCAQ